MKECRAVYPNKAIKKEAEKVEPTCGSMRAGGLAVSGIRLPSSVLT